MEIVFESTGNIEAYEEEELIEQEPVQIDQEHLSVPGQADPTRSYSNSEHIIEEVIEEEEVEKVEENEEEVIEEKEEEVIEEKEEKEDETRERVDVGNIVIPSGNDYVYDGFEPYSSISYNNIIDTPLNEYNVSESLQLLIFLSMFIGGFILLIRRAVLKWS